ncbi:DUF6072 family protein [Breoghania sp. L-A4]|uniref:DUF6072 family protein n=1 Tax=Breoghania sp. L-A4 TaxID=2304600 RepID=UPI000E35E695|nr:DUF6072 family protein [Breoghania sp. L-A4]AXS40787.1 hypothetical protein D1F64_12930 [Breoghania sp. L-A4]
MQQPSHAAETGEDIHTTEDGYVRPDGITMLANGAKIIGEAVLPGASLLADGKFVNGVVHTALGFGARAATGPIGFAVVAADSYSKSVTDKHLWTHVSDIATELRGSYRARRAARQEMAAKAPHDGAEISAEAEESDAKTTRASSKTTSKD